MRSLAEPAVLKSAGIAALISSVLCYPRLASWEERPQSLWYLEALVLIGGMVLWAFVFAWHTQYTRRPVFTLRIGWKLFLVATTAGLALALALHAWIDPSLRPIVPRDYPADFQQWLAMLLFSLAFTQLFLVFAPFAWLLRLSRGRPMAIPLTVLFGAYVMLVRQRNLTAPLPSPLFAALLAAQLAQSFVSVYFFLRGGVLLVWWWYFLLHCRHLSALTGA